MKATIRKWGNSAAVRLSRKELRRLGLREGDDVEIEVRSAGGNKAWDVSMIPVFRSDGPTFKQAREQARGRLWEARHARR